LIKYFLLSLAVFLTLAPPARADQYHFATFDFPPFEHEQDGKVQGMGVELVTEAMKRLGHTVDIKVYPIARALEETKTGQIDGVFTAYKTPEREAYLTYSHEVLIAQAMCLFVPKDSKITYDGNLCSLGTSKIGIINKMSYGKIFDGAAKDGTLKDFEPSNDTALNIKKLLANRTDIIISSRLAALYFAKTLGVQDQIRELVPPVETVPSYLAFTRTKDMTALADSFDKEIRAMHADGTYDRIMKSCCQ
jgi:polar amino acid transport system substrate-binding protein